MTVASAQTPLSGLALSWPVEGTSSSVSQDYAQYNGIGNAKFHTGMDIAATAGTNVKAAASGYVYLFPMTMNGGLFGAASQDNHCMGNIVVIDHTSPRDQEGPFTLYAHLQAISTSLSSGAFISAGTVIGTVGRTGFDSAARALCQSTASAHLHFELKMKPTLHNPFYFDGASTVTNPSVATSDCTTAPPCYWGYTPTDPDANGYRDPVLNLHSGVTALPAGTTAQVISVVSMRPGPGAGPSGLGTPYPAVASTTSNGTYRAVAQALPTTTPACSQGWIQLRKSDAGAIVGSSQLVSGQYRDLWSCKGDVANYLTVSGSAVTYSLTLSAQPVAGGSVTGAGSFSAGASRTVTAVASSGYSFVNWTEGGSQVSASSSYTFALNANRVLVANFAAVPVSYTLAVSASPSAGGSVTGAGSFSAGTSRTVTATASSGYSFVNWTEGGSQVSSSASYAFTLNSNRTLVANFVAVLVNYNVTVSASPVAGGTVSGGGTFSAGMSLTVVATASSGYNFVNWTVNGSQVSTSSSYTFPVNANRALVANFTAASVNRTLVLSASPVAGGSVSGAGTFSAGTTRTVNATPSGGYVFVNWTESGSQVSASSTYSFVLNSSRTLVANFSSTADVSITQSPSARVGVGKDVVYTLNATNAGPATTNVTLVDALPAASMFVWASPGCANSSMTVTCNLGSLAGGTSAQVKVVVRSMVAGVISNNVSASGAHPDPNPANNLSSSTITVDPTPAGVPATRYRLYSPVTLEHHFTTDANEYSVLGTYVGTWVQEGTVGKLLDNPGSFNGVVAIPYYRLYDTLLRSHHWTTDANEYYTLIQNPRWNAEGVDGYILPSETAGATRLYRLLYPFIGGLHHWTIDAHEYDVLTATYGWIGEGGAGFVLH